MKNHWNVLFCLATCISLFCCSPTKAQTPDTSPLSHDKPEIKLWPDGLPGAEANLEGNDTAEVWRPSTDGFHRVTNIHDPSITAYLAPQGTANGAAVVICPGGGHSYLVVDLEGSQVAGKLNAMGISVFVLKSRLARAPGSTYKIEEHSLQDTQRAIRLVRSRAEQWNLDPERIGVMGFSAGAELAELASLRFADVQVKEDDPIDSLSSRPDFSVIVYGGIRQQNLTIPENTPPTFLVVSNDDGPSAMMARYYAQLKSNNIPAELHIYLEGGHGYGMTGRTPAFRDLPISHWPEQLEAWMDRMSLLEVGQ